MPVRGFARARRFRHLFLLHDSRPLLDNIKPLHIVGLNITTTVGLFSSFSYRELRHALTMCNRLAPRLIHCATPWPFLPALAGLPTAYSIQYIVSCPRFKIAANLIWRSMVKCSSANIIAWKHASNCSFDWSYPIVVTSSLPFLVLSTFRPLMQAAATGYPWNTQRTTCCYRDEASDCSLHVFAIPLSSQYCSLLFL